MITCFELVPDEVRPDHWRLRVADSEVTASATYASLEDALAEILRRAVRARLLTYDGLRRISDECG